MPSSATEDRSRSAGRRPVRLGLIGCGRLGTGFYIPAIAAARDVSLAAIAEPDLGRSLAAREVAFRLHGDGVRVCPSARVLVETGAIDAVVISGPAGTHAEQAALAAGAGIPALVEKPPATDLEGAVALAALDPAPRIGFNRRFTPAGELVAAPPPGSVELELQLEYLRARWRPHTARAEPLEDVGCHLIDLGRAFLGPVGSSGLRARAVRLSARGAIAELRGDRGSARIRCANNRPWRERATVRDAAGAKLASVSVGGLLAGFRSRIGGHPDPLAASLIAQLEAFAATVRGGEGGRLAGAGDGIAVMGAIAAIRRSAASGGSWIELDSALPRSSGAIAP